MSMNSPLTFASRMSRKLCLLTAALALFPVIASSQEYTVTNLGTLGGSTSTAWAVNDSGQVVGSANIAGDAHADPFLYSNGTMTDVWGG
jgi:probable HAF family extracellular repeat protein